MVTRSEATRDPSVYRSLLTILMCTHLDYVRARADRVEAAHHAHEAGLTWTEIGLTFDMTPSGARALARRRQEDES